MPHHKSAEKRVRTNEKSRQRNVAIRSRLRRSLTAQRSLEKAEEVVGALPHAVAEVDVAKRKGVIPAGRANRLKSRLAKAANRTAAATPATAEAAPKRKSSAKKSTKSNG